MSDFLGGQFAQSEACLAPDIPGYIEVIGILQRVSQLAVSELAFRLLGFFLFISYELEAGIRAPGWAEFPKGVAIRLELRVHDIFGK
jgi:hypothetical protein